MGIAVEGLGAENTSLSLTTMANADPRVFQSFQDPLNL